VKIAVYPGSFDPVTKGHVELIFRAATLFDKVIVAVLNNPEKHPLFSVDERIELIRDSLAQVDTDATSVEVDSFGGLLAHYVKERGAIAIVRGLRSTLDFENELQMAQMNWALYDAASTVFLPTDAETGFISSSLVKQIAAHHGDVRPFVPAAVVEALTRKYS